MTKNYALALMLLACLLVLAMPAWPADTIAAWTFDSQTTAPTIGSGTAVLIGGVANYGTGWASGNPSGYAWNTSTFPSQGAGNRTAGIQFSVSTTGYAGINVSFDRRNSSTASRYLRFQFSTDGGATWNDGATGSLTSVADIIFHTCSFDLGAFGSVVNNPNFSFRMVAEFDPSTGLYTGATGSYAGSGTIRWDNVTVTGIDTIPPSVTIDQASGQSDPTSSQPVNFTVVFSEPVVGFSASGVSTTGSAGGTKTVSVTGVGSTYNVAISGISSAGTVVATVAAGAAQDLAGNWSTASTSADNSVTFERAAAAPLRIANWNVTNYCTSSARDADFQAAIYGVFEGRSMSPDILIGEEFLIPASVAEFKGLLNTAVGSPGDWDSATFVEGSDTNTGFFFRTSKVQLLGQTIVHTGGNTPEVPRTIVRYDVSPKGFSPGSAPVLAIYGSHMKSGTTADDKARRLLEAQYIRGNAELLNPAWSFFFGGDMNMQSSGEAAYQWMVGSQSNNAGRFHDPIDSPGSWYNYPAFTFVHTQDPSDYSQTGGMDDRFDLLLLSADLIDGVGFDYIGNSGVPYSTSTWNDPNHSFRAWGNDGTSFNLPVTVTGNTMVGPQIAQSLRNSCPYGGHLPVFLEMRLPAELDVSPTVLDFGAVLVNTGLSLPIDVANGADSSIWGLDGIAALTYSMSATSGFAAPSGSFSDEAGGGHNAHLISVDTSTPGAKLGLLSITPSDPKIAPRTIELRANVVLPLTATVNQAVGQRDPTNARPVKFRAVFNGPVEDFSAGDVVVSGTAGGPRTVSVTGTGATYDVAVSDVTSTGTVVVAIPAGAAHCGAANPNSASTSADNSVNVFHIGPLAMTNRSVGEGYGLSAVGLWVKISGIVSNLTGTSCDVDDGSGPVHVAFGSASVGGSIADGKYVTVSGQVSSSSPRTVTCSPDDEVLVY